MCAAFIALAFSVGGYLGLWVGRRRTARLREALIPFAGLPETDEAETDVPNESRVTIHCELGDMRRAFHALHYN